MRRLACHGRGKQRPYECPRSVPQLREALTVATRAIWSAAARRRFGPQPTRPALASHAGCPCWCPLPAAGGAADTWVPAGKVSPRAWGWSGAIAGLPSPSLHPEAPCLGRTFHVRIKRTVHVLTTIPQFPLALRPQPVISCARQNVHGPRQTNPRAVSPPSVPNSCGMCTYVTASLHFS